jgi:hypothetical protein
MVAVLAPHASNIIGFYLAFSVVGWALVGLPVVVLGPPELLSRLAWPLVVVIGAILGPISLLVIFAALFAFQGRLGEFSLAHTESLWLLASLVSTVGFLVYSALVRWWLNESGESLG